VPVGECVHFVSTDQHPTSHPHTFIDEQGRPVFDFVLMSFENVYSNILPDFLPHHFYFQD